jgi:hypothetical protein
MTETWINDADRIKELEGRVREFERLIAVVAKTATEMAGQLKQALVVTTAIPMRSSGVVSRALHDQVMAQLKGERDAAVDQVRMYESQAEAYRESAFQVGKERDALRTRVAELETDRDQWRKRVEMEDLEVMGIIGVNDRG